MNVIKLQWIGKVKHSSKDVMIIGISDEHFAFTLNNHITKLHGSNSNVEIYRILKINIRSKL